jgi:threonine dehydrogenase-like Zn-dependent dehydrogenase
VIAGHEPCGVVAALGPGNEDSGVHEGDRVMVHHYLGCGHCEHCDVGWSQLCQHGITVYGVTGNGAHAPYMKVPTRTLVALPDALSFETGAAISCGTGTAFAALGRLGLSGRDTIAIFGQGPVGLSATQLASAMGARVIALDISPERRKLAEEFGAHAAVDAGAGDAAEALMAMTGGRGVDLALDCSGVPAARAAAVRATRVWGRACFVGEGDSVTLDVSRDMLRKQITLIGSWTFSRPGQGACARFVAERGIAVDRLFTHRFKLDEAAEAYRLFDQQTMGKGVFLPS